MSPTAVTVPRTVPVTFENCWAWENGILAGGGDSAGDGMGFKLGGQRDESNDSGGNTVTGCMSWGNRENGFTDNEATIANVITRCTAYANGNISFETHADGTVVTSNISYLPGLADTNIADDTNVTRNSWDTIGITVTADDFRSLDDTAATGSRMDHGQLPATDFLRLAPRSDMVRAGYGGKNMGARQ